MSKRILRVTFESVEVDDDYQLTFRNNAGEDVVVSEHDGHVYSCGQSGNQWYFFSSDVMLNGLSPVMQFIWWSTIAWQAFYHKVPKKLRMWLDRFTENRDPALTYARSVHERASRRREEVESGMIHFKDWDEELFTRQEKLFSVN